MHTDNAIMEPVLDKNPTQIQPVPAEHEAQTPEWLSQKIRELDDVRTERGKLLADTMRPVNCYGSDSYKSNVRKDWERSQENRELDGKEDVLMAQIRTYMYLMPPNERPPSLGFYSVVGIG